MRENGIRSFIVKTVERIPFPRIRQNNNNRDKRRFSEPIPPKDYPGLLLGLAKNPEGKLIPVIKDRDTPYKLDPILESERKPDLVLAPFSFPHGSRDRKGSYWWSLELFFFLKKIFFPEINLFVIEIIPYSLLIFVHLAAYFQKTIFSWYHPLHGYLMSYLARLANGVMNLPTTKDQCRKFNLHAWSRIIFHGVYW